MSRTYSVFDLVVPDKTKETSVVEDSEFFSFQSCADNLMSIKLNSDGTEVTIRKFRACDKTESTEVHACPELPRLLAHASKLVC